ncbi:hypothetical protein MRX96_001345 [Rhipicephalus microplus]
MGAPASRVMLKTHVPVERMRLQGVSLVDAAFRRQELLYQPAERKRLLSCVVQASRPQRCRMPKQKSGSATAAAG